MPKLSLEELKRNLVIGHVDAHNLGGYFGQVMALYIPTDVMERYNDAVEWREVYVTGGTEEERLAAQAAALEAAKKVREARGPREPAELTQGLIQDIIIAHSMTFCKECTAPGGFIQLLPATPEFIEEARKRGVPTAETVLANASIEHV